MKEVKLYLPAFISVGLVILLVFAMTDEMKKKKAMEQPPVTNKILLELETDSNCTETIPYAKDIYTYCLNAYI